MKIPEWFFIFFGKYKTVQNICLLKNNTGELVVNDGACRDLIGPVYMFLICKELWSFKQMNYEKFLPYLKCHCGCEAKNWMIYVEEGNQFQSSFIILGKRCWYLELGWWQQRAWNSTGISFVHKIHSFGGYLNTITMRDLTRKGNTFNLISVIGLAHIFMSKGLNEFNEQSWKGLRVLLPNLCWIEGNGFSSSLN